MAKQINAVAAKKIAALETISEQLGVFTKELLTEYESIDETTFRIRWLPMFLSSDGGLLTHWVQEVSLNPHLAVNVVNANKEVVCIVPPLYAPMGTTITKANGKINLSNILHEAKLRGDQLPTQREMLIVDSMTPFVDHATTDPKWAAQWVKLCKYFGVEQEGLIGKDIEVGVSNEPAQEGTNDYDDFEEI